MDGIANGIKNAAGWLADAARDAAKAALDAAKGFLGIESPSKAFALLGRQSMAGFAEGITALVPTVRATTAAAVAPPALRPGGNTTVSTVNNYNLTTNSWTRPGALALEFSALAMGSR